MKSTESGKDIFMGTLDYKDVKITDDRFKECIVFNKKAYEFNTTIFDLNDDGSYRAPLYYLSLITERLTTDIHISIIEIK